MAHISIAVVYHSGFGHTARQAEAVAEGVTGVAGATATLIPVDKIDEHWDTLAQADGIIFGSPTYMGGVSAPFKTFMDASSKVWYARGWANKVAAGFTNSASQSGDKLNTLIQLTIFAAQHGMLWVGLDLLPGNNNSKGSVDDLNRLGGFLGALAQSNADQGPEHGPLPSDLKTAAHLGARVATTTLQLARGKAE